MAPPPAQPTLVGLSGPANGETFPLAQPEVHIGRDESNEICLPDSAVSRRHCVCAQGATGWTLRDLGSFNGTFVNNIAAGERELANGDHIGIGTSVLLFVSGVHAEVTAGQLEDGSPGVDSRTVDIAATQYLGRASEAAAPRVERNLRALLAMSTAINAVQSEDELHTELLRVVRELTPAQQAAIVVLDPETGLTVRAGTAAGSGPTPVSRDAVTRVMQERIGIHAHDPQSGTAYLCAPLAAANTVLGAIFVAASGSAGLLDEDHLQLITALGRIAAIPLDNLRRTAALREETERLRADVRLQHNMIGDSEPMQRVYQRINLVAPADTTVLIMGETGSGKELAARAIHTSSPRARRPFIALNCAAIPETLLESELFGYERGAFTGAVTFKPGKLEAAQGGTLFLDEIGEMSPALQGKLLRVLEQREFERVGGTRTIKADIRVVSATNRALPAEVAAGRFRSDLYFRLNVVSIAMPPLRDRREDIPLLARYFLNRFSKTATRRITGIAPAALSCLSAYAWPGNARELENAIGDQPPKS
jgi:transcriptional regulator with GAF, ATPase, and Fis domain